MRRPGGCDQPCFCTIIKPWDNNMYKMAATVGVSDRVRMQLLGLSIPLVSQGIPFLQMGSDFLRSKSMERDKVRIPETGITRWTSHWLRVTGTSAYLERIKTQG